MRERRLIAFNLIGFALAAMGLYIAACDAPSPSSPAAKARFQLFLSRSSVPADGASTVTITAQIQDRDGKPASGLLSFKTNLGRFKDEFPLAFSNGQATVTYVASDKTGTATVEGETLSIRDPLRQKASITLGTPKYRLDLSAAAPIMPTNSINTLSAQLYDSDTGEAAPEGVQVNFKVCGFQYTDFNFTTGEPGALDAGLVRTNTEGIALTRYFSTDAQGIQTIAAWAGSLLPPRPESCPPADAGYVGYDAMDFTVREDAPTVPPTWTPYPTATKTPTSNIVQTATPTPGTGTPTPTPSRTPTPQFTLFPKVVR